MSKGWGEADLAMLLRIVESIHGKTRQQEARLQQMCNELWCRCYTTRFYSRTHVPVKECPTVEVVDMHSGDIGLLGKAILSDNRIRIRSGLNDVIAVGTLAHELAHMLGPLGHDTRFWKAFDWVTSHGWRRSFFLGKLSKQYTPDTEFEMWLTLEHGGDTTLEPLCGGNHVWAPKAFPAFHKEQTDEVETAPKKREETVTIGTVLVPIEPEREGSDE